MARPRKSIELSKKLGTAEAQRILGRADVANGPDPDPPHFMSAGAAKIWELVVPHLVAANLTQRIDSLTLCQYCEAYAEWQRAKRRRGKNRDPRATEAWFDRAARLADKLGMNVRARTQITVPAKEEPSKIDQLLG